MTSIAQLFDGYIVNKSNEGVCLNDEKYKGKVFGLYFSAHWCPPCRGFTPMLIEFYKNHGKEKNFEIIFISSDRDEKAFNEYFKEMPWLTLRYSERKKKEELGKRFHITGIPTLMLLDGDSGDVICKDARDNIQHRDTRGDFFPWKS
ncbi:unnamed protein product [Rotaria magnacalcarata]|uniref:Thioredoxin domain-containing protein n=1 Tax=Rotaria magnacalcarata TaxID=392030 RepID=A0A815K189_9BILA|nr:unnamed protein product [Rotaria magnacalcarata]CAF1626814.1 unnamed protein product [Rotaria magnacalcarata]CAF2061925.1 unnamed protein product [Rotaria magnacalcarata]CAF2091224.1 unnamed protein product [Rotaria magnacalcarata]CAF2098606.1 unnamed protein product [Rotaria magnacalcarata]